MFVDAVLPAASEAVMVYGGALASGAFAEHDVTLFGVDLDSGFPAYLAISLAGTIGYTLGSIAGWAIGLYGGRPFVERRGRWVHMDEERLERADQWFARWGDWAVFFGRITPVVRSFVAIPAGIARMPLGRYTVLTFLGSAIWCFGLAGIGWALGANWERFHHAFHYADVRGRRRGRGRGGVGGLGGGGGRLHSTAVQAIPHVDVRAQYAPLIPELEQAFREVLDSGRFILGPNVKAFEREAADKLGVPEAVGVANGTDALVLVFDALGIGPGDEVVCPSFTFYATAETIARVGATPVFAEIDPRTLNLDPADVAERITPRTKAIVPVHLFGRPADVEALTGLGVPLIEDAAQAFGAAGVGRTGVASTYSFFPTKNLFCLGDGGLVAATDPEVAERVRLLRFHGSRDKQTFDLVGTNSRLDEIQAAALRIFLREIDGWNAQRRRRGRALRRARSRRARGAAARRAGPRLPHVLRADARARPAARGLHGAGDRACVLLHDPAPPAARLPAPRVGARLAPRDRARRGRERLPAALGRDHSRAAGARRGDACARALPAAVR